MLFVQEVLGVESVDPWQQDVLRAFGRGERRISIASCPGVGKSAVASWLVLYMLLFRFPQNTVATAPSTPQLEDALVVRIHEWLARMPPVLQSLLEVKKNRIELKARPSESWFSARTAKAESPEAFQGVHSKYTLLIADEASGVPEEIYKAGSGSMTDENATTLLISNPTRSSGFFYDTHHKLKDMWFRVKVGFKDSPRVTEDFRVDIARRYGEDSNEYRIRVLGEFPKSDLDTIIGRDLVDSARVRDVTIPKRIGFVWGLDVARFGDDENVLIRRSLLHVDPKILVWSKTDLMETVGRVKSEWDECDEWSRPSEILVDEIGLGAGVVDALKRMKMPGTEVRGINVGEASSAKEKYLNLRSELWFAARDWLASKNHGLPKCSTSGGCAHDCVHERLASELTIPRYKYTMTGKLQIEPKDEIKKRGFKSPNVADSFVLSFAGEPALLMDSSQAWNQPLKRNLHYV